MGLYLWMVSDAGACMTGRGSVLQACLAATRVKVSQVLVCGGQQRAEHRLAASGSSSMHEPEGHIVGAITHQLCDAGRQSAAAAPGL